MSPLANLQQLEKVEELVRSAQEQGARLVCGGERLQGDPYDDGFYFAPTLSPTPKRRFARKKSLVPSPG